MRSMDVCKVGTGMKERPIVLSGNEVIRVVAEGRAKIRIPLNPQPTLDGNFWTLGGAGWSVGIDTIVPIPHHSLYYACPLGEPGDRLWVQEAWSQPVGNEEKVWSPPDITEFPGAIMRYDVDGTFNNFHGEFYTKWFKNSPENMPRWASRISLEITDIRIERLQKSDADDLAQFINPGRNFGNDCFGIEDNPWIWMVEFRTIERTTR